jgi:folate-dependent tRNA-U54 methylase TrmFO/GidA
MNVNFGLFPPLPESAGKHERKPRMARRALAALDGWLASDGTWKMPACHSRENR